jgi:hypothetical protein
VGHLHNIKIISLSRLDGFLFLRSFYQRNRDYTVLLKKNVTTNVFLSKNVIFKISNLKRFRVAYKSFNATLC